MCLLTARPIWAVQRSWLCRRFWDGFPAFVLQTIDVAFLAKSLGTLCAVRTAKALGLRPRFFLLTPLEETLQELPQGADVFGAVVGTKDAHLAADQLEQFCKARAIPCLIVPDAGHRLQFEDADKTQAVNRSITAMLR